MHNTGDHNTVAKSMRDALLLTVIADRSLLIRADQPEQIPYVFGAVRILDNALRWQAVEQQSPQARARPERFLARVYDGSPINVLSSVDPVCYTMKGLLSGTADEPDAPLQSPTERMHVFIQIANDDVPEFINSRMSYSVNCLRLPPATVKGLIDQIMADDEFSPENIAALRSRHAHVMENISRAFMTRVVKAARATRPDTVEFMERVGTGILPTFGYGIGVRTEINLLRICAAHAVISGRDYVRSSDLVEHFPKVGEHAIAWGAAQPRRDTTSALTQIAEWAVSI